MNSDTGKPVIVDDSRLTAGEFEKVKIAETIETRGEKSCRPLHSPLHSPLWQADSDKIRRMAPIEFIGRYMPQWFDYAICDEIHQLAGDTAQGNALGTLASCTDRIVGLTGTLLGGYADDLFNTLFRLEARRMKEHGYEWGTTGRSSFIQDYGVLETITKVEPANNACSMAKSTSTVRRKPGVFAARVNRLRAIPGSICLPWRSPRLRHSENGHRGPNRAVLNAGSTGSSGLTRPPVASWDRSRVWLGIHAS